MPPVEEDQLPAALISRFTDTTPDRRMIALLRFLGPITGGQVRAV
jgi:hypothetical protein